MTAVVEVFWHADGGMLPAAAVVVVCLVLAPVAGSVADRRARRSRQRAEAMRLHPSSVYRQAGGVR